MIVYSLAGVADFVQANIGVCWSHLFGLFFSYFTLFNILGLDFWRFFYFFANDASFSRTTIIFNKYCWRFFFSSQITPNCCLTNELWCWNVCNKTRLNDAAMARIWQRTTQQYTIRERIHNNSTTRTVMIWELFENREGKNMPYAVGFEDGSNSINVCNVRYGGGYLNAWDNGCARSICECVCLSLSVWGLPDARHRQQSN